MDRIRALFVLLVATLALAVDHGATASTLDSAALADAALLDVHFVNPTTGWAVGERGVVWHTRDAGASWKRQPSGVGARLTGVRFRDETTGWAVGGTTLPYSRRSRGIVLHTADGGRSWRAAERLLIPALEGLCFSDAGGSVAFGRSSAAFRAGVWLTADGGQNWRQAAPPAGGLAQGWLAGDFLDLRTGALGGRNGRIAVVSQQRVSPLSDIDFGHRTVHAIRLQPNGHGWLAGDGGLVRKTADVGKSWQSPATELLEMTRRFDLQALAVIGSNIWIAGTPGTKVFHSSDGGKTWQASTTGSYTPIYAMAFVDANRGWAVGELGTILATSDGGQTWVRTRAGGERAALLAIFSTPREVPLETLARLAAADGYLTAVETLFRPGHTNLTANSANGSPPPNSSCPPDVAREAMLSVGATAAATPWRFPTPPKSTGLLPHQVWAEFDRMHDGEAAQRIEERLVRTIRMWRPDVIVTHSDVIVTHSDVIVTHSDVIVTHSDDNESQPLRQHVTEAVTRAIDAAADPTRYVDLATEAELGAWQVKKVFGQLPPGAHGSIRFSASELDTRLGRTLGDWTAGPRAMIVGPFSVAAEEQTFSLLRHSLTTVDDRRIFGGIALQPGGGARRPHAAAPATDLQTLRRMAQKRRNMRKLLEKGNGTTAWSGQIDDLTNGLDPHAAAELLFQLAAKYRADGRRALAEQTFEQLAARHHEHPLADVALEWLISSYASGETGQWAASVEAMPVRQPAAKSEARAAIHDKHDDRGAEPAALVEPTTDRLARVLAYGNYLERSRPLLFAEPSVQLPIAVAARKRGFDKDAGRTMLAFQHRDGDAFWNIAHAERWLSDRGHAGRVLTTPPKPLLTCGRAVEPPFLDGKLNDRCWQTARAAQLVSDPPHDLADPPAAIDRPPSASPHPPSQVRLTRDERFLYLAIRCQKRDPSSYRVDDRPRPRDADLSDSDRVTIHLDIDRDYTTYWSLTVDHRGWTHDACWGDANWDPTWYVAAASNESTWTVEAAMRLSELTASPIGPQDAWAVGVSRIIPGVGTEGWPIPRGADVQPQQFGLLLFGG